VSVKSNGILLGGRIILLISNFYLLSIKDDMKSIKYRVGRLIRAND